MVALATTYINKTSNKSRFMSKQNEIRISGLVNGLKFVFLNAEARADWRGIESIAEFTKRQTNLELYSGENTRSWFYNFLLGLGGGSALPLTGIKALFEENYTNATLCLLPFLASNAFSLWTQRPIDQRSAQQAREEIEKERNKELDNLLKIAEKISSWQKTPVYHNKFMVRKEFCTQQDDLTVKVGKIVRESFPSFLDATAGGIAIILGGKGGPVYSRSDEFYVQATKPDKSYQRFDRTWFFAPGPVVAYGDPAIEELYHSVRSKYRLQRLRNLLSIHKNK
jgi:hypothetical protein